LKGPCDTTKLLSQDG